MYNESFSPKSENKFAFSCPMEMNKVNNETAKKVVLI